MPRQRCPSCSMSAPAAAKFCPRCGRGFSDGKPVHDPGVVPSKSRIPFAGILFIAAAVLGPALITAGVYTGIPALLYSGIAVAVGLIVLLVLGLFF